MDDVKKKVMGNADCKEKLGLWMTYNFAFTKHHQFAKMDLKNNQRKAYAPFPLTGKNKNRIFYMNAHRPRISISGSGYKSETPG